MNTKLKVLMLTKILAAATLATSAFADNNYLDNAGSVQGDNDLAQNSIGIGYAYSQNIYEGVGNKTQPFPLLNLSYDDFFIKGFTAGYNAYQDDNLSLSLVVRPMFGGYDADESNDLKGMDDTSYLINTGVQAQYRLMPFVFTVAALHDVSGRSDGNSASAKLAAMIPLDDKRFILIPSMSATWESSDITEYYYGVSSSEATATRPKYTPSSAINYGYGLTLKYQVAEHWSATAGYVLTQYADDITDSPIVNRKYASSLLAGISYIF